MCFSCDLVFLIVFSPHFDVLAVKQIKPLDLILQHIDNCFSNLLLCDVFLELSVVGKYVKYTQEIDTEVDVSLMILCKCTTQDLK